MKNTEMLDMLEQELRMIWQQANSSTGTTKQALLAQYRTKHASYRKTKIQLSK